MGNNINNNNKRAPSAVSFLLLLLVLLCQQFLAAAAEAKTYLLSFGGEKPTSFETRAEWYASQLQSLSPLSISTAEAAKSKILYSYNVVNGAAVSLEKEEADTLRGLDNVLLIEDHLYSLHTSRTPEFLGLDKLQNIGSSKGSSHGHDELFKLSQDVIIGVLDTGITPNSKSFNENEMGPVPAKWKGGCDDIVKKSCNKKLIGARSFVNGHKGNNANDDSSDSPVDVDGHGTHTASTAAGAAVQNASLFGLASGTARGMAPGARIAAYKVCTASGCYGSDILAGIEAAIEDGVDVISMSLGGLPGPYYKDPIAVATFAAMERGILVSCSAGNSGPYAASVSNLAPWILTVGASTMDRDFPAAVNLGDGRKVAGISLYPGRGKGKKKFGLVYGESCSEPSPSFAGKIVLCDRGGSGRVEKGSVVKKAGGKGMVLANTAIDGEQVLADAHLLRALAVGNKAGNLIREYINNNNSKTAPTAAITFQGTVVGVKPAPVVGSFSSRGPNSVTPQILKPDIIAPGVNILAAWPGTVPPTELVEDKRRVLFNILSGTSMSCPHMSGLAALLKAAHPGWSPAAIKSALMTTAYMKDNTNSSIQAQNGVPATPFDRGAGHVDFVKAVSPGLVYDISQNQYRMFLCSLGYNDTQLSLFTTNPRFHCNKNTTLKNPGSLNYPSFSVLFGEKTKVVHYTRILTNVGPAKSVYRASVEAPAFVTVSVSPKVISFNEVGERVKYTVSFVPKKGANKYTFGSLTWHNEQYQVRSPIAVTWE
ncbi:unnamed protein product [Cuscuta campestris]|uniref:Subtilisin-like protease fibronectin type-III domain-containing protein n=1 Tax=Cuscuta campestris TaxID=132261 RepID=A0A484N3A3_9ASTE|nr:unnamed protein product [Cuscuta campestris]